MTTTCPHCKTVLDADGVGDGEQVECPRCSRRFRFSAPASPDAKPSENENQDQSYLLDIICPSCEAKVTLPKDWRTNLYCCPHCHQQISDPSKGQDGIIHAISVIVRCLSLVAFSVLIVDSMVNDLDSTLLALSLLCLVTFFLAQVSAHLRAIHCTLVRMSGNPRNPPYVTAISVPQRGASRQPPR
jgi:uncharacterized paraquat-inducible protein A